MASRDWRIMRTRSDILRLVPFAIVLATGFLQFLLIAISLLDWVVGAAPFPGGEAGFQALVLSCILTAAGAAGMAAFLVARMSRPELASLRAKVGARYGGTLHGIIARKALAWFERHPSPARTYAFRSDYWPLAFALVCASLCLLFALAGFAYFYDELAWFFPSAAFLLMLPIALFWLSHAAGRRNLPSKTVAWGLAAGVMCAIPAVLIEVYFSRSIWTLAGLFGGADATLLDLLDGAVGAPLAEEGVKVAAVILLILAGKASSRREGFAAGICVGLGFAFYENVLYNMSGFEAVSPVLLLRPINMALHMLGPAIVGAALGGLRWGEAKPALAIAGIVIGVGVHAMWNGLLGAMPYLSALAVRIGGSDQAVLVTILVHIFVTPLLISGTLYVAGKRLAS